MKNYEKLEQKIKELQDEVNRLKREEKMNKIPNDFDRNNAIKYLNTRNQFALTDAFDWESTVKGYRYWEEVCGGEDLCDEDIIQIQKWIIQSFIKEYES
jgi:hypothetical protein